MDLFMIMKERYMFLAIIIIIIFMSLLLIFTTWKRRSNIPKSLLIFITSICTILIISSLFALVFTVSFGYNS
ncbi:hypothetical protein SPD48_08625 [Pseudogracilibacillus sp. SE30717A]|uniref:hypothetical protein n=1 Tax=Pseudogracilibacillus sp. SE30717A TaxID=3098293 RepID=UPI00300E3DC1